MIELTDAQKIERRDAMNAALQEERKRFEAWMGAANLKRTAFDDYVNCFVHAQWNAWQARSHDEDARIIAAHKARRQADPNAAHDSMQADYLLAARIAEGHLPDACPPMTMPLAGLLYAKAQRQAVQEPAKHPFKLWAEYETKIEALEREAVFLRKLVAKMEKAAAPQPVTQAQQEPVGWMAFEGTVALHGYAGMTEYEVKFKVLDGARQEGYKGMVSGRLLELGWHIAPIYTAAPQPADSKGATHE